MSEELGRGYEVKTFGPVRLEGIEYVPAPVGALCAYCEEPIALREGGFWIVHVEGDGASHRPYHRECWERQVLGGVAHAERRCRCFGGSASDLDPPGMTKRQAARAARDARLRQGT